MKKLAWPDIRKIGTIDNGNRWFPIADIKEYFDPLRTPSRAWPHSYAKAAQTVKFAKWCIVYRPVLAARLGLTV